MVESKRTNFQTGRPTLPTSLIEVLRIYMNGIPVFSILIDQTSTVFGQNKSTKQKSPIGFCSNHFSMLPNNPRNMGMKRKGGVV